MFAKFSSKIYQRVKRNGFYLKGCLLIQIQDEPRFYKDLKIFKFMKKIPYLTILGIC